MVGRHALAGFALLALLALSLSSCAEPRDDRIYRYVDEHGRVVFVTGLQRVPSEHREAAEPVTGAANEGGAAPDDAGPDGATADDDAPDLADGQVVYRYPGPRGRPAFTNRRDLVPEALRARMKVVDLSHVSTNPELGRDLNAAIDREMERLAASSPCKKARADVNGGRLALLWRNERHLVVVAGILAALLLVTPWAVRRFGAPWLRVLAFAIPVLLLTGVLAHAMILVNRSISAGIKMTDLCDPTSTPSASGAGTGGGSGARGAGGTIDPGALLRARVEHTDQLRAAVEAAIAGPEARIQEELSH
jgi:hypothetical protein